MGLLSRPPVHLRLINVTEHRLTRFNDVHAALCNPALRQSLYDAGEVIMKDVLLTLHGDAHKKRRHLELRLFRRNFAYEYETRIFPVTLDSVLTPLLAKGEADLVEFGYRITMNLTADFAGIDRPKNDDAETNKLLSIVKTFSEGATIAHTDRNPDDVIAEVRDALATFQDFLKPSWQRRQSLIDAYNHDDLPESELPRDVLTVLLRNQDNIELPLDVITREIAFYLQAGSHSTANSMVHAVHEIFSWSENPKSLLDNPLLLQRCVHESMRLHPASPVALRTPTIDTAITSELSATPDDLLILDLSAANRDPSIFGEDAEVFNPHRTLNRSKTSLYGLTFGTGVHMCTGRDLDGGVASQATTDPDTHQYGIVCRLITALLEQAMTPHRTRSPAKDTNTQRDNWGLYPIEFR
jgi:cytochrome P450